MQAWPTAGGWRFPADPELRADRQKVLWLPDVHAGTVILQRSSSRFGDSIAFAPQTWAADVHVRRADDGSYLALSSGGSEHRLWTPSDLQAGERVTAVIPLDQSAPARAEATLRFWRFAHDGLIRQPSTPGKQQSKRLLNSLRALDGRRTGASYRSVAEGLFGQARVATESWKTSSVRDTTIRLVRTGIRMMQSGYRKLLGSRSKD